MSQNAKDPDAKDPDVKDPVMTLREATAEEIAESLSFALRYEGRRRVNHADDIMARITADRLVRHLAESGFVLMRRPGAVAPSTT